MSRLLTRHTIRVQQRRIKHIAAGTVYENVGDPVDVRCDFRYVSSTETTQNGIVVDYVARALVPGSWPYGTTPSIVHAGEAFEIEGLPLVRDGSVRTAHTQLNLRYAGQAA